MTGPFLDAAIVAALRANPGANQDTIRAEVGSSKYDFDCAVQRLRNAGKVTWERFKLSPSMQDATPTVRPRTKRKALTATPPRPGDALLAKIDGFCATTGTRETVIGQMLFRHSGFVALLRLRGTLSMGKRIAVEKLLEDHPGGLGDLTPAIRKTLTEIDAERLMRERPQATEDSPSAGPLPTPADAKGAGNARREDRKASLPPADPTLPAPTTLGAVPRMILERLLDGPQWIRSFQKVKPHLVQSIESGLVERCRPHMGRAANQVRITDAGRAALALGSATLEPLRPATTWSNPTTPRPEVRSKPAQSENIADKFRRLAAEVESDEAEALAEAEADERRDRELNRLPSPSAILRRAKRDWPKQCADVQALAIELHISLGEAWRRTIAAGVDCMRAGDDGEAMA